MEITINTKKQWFPTLVILIISVVCGCSTDEVALMQPEAYERTELEVALSSREWRYKGDENGIVIKYNNKLFKTNIYDAYLEPNTGVAFRDRLYKKGVKYDLEMTYQLRWDNRGEYQLGTPGYSNWQPSYGTWKIDEENRKFYHNPNTSYETVYDILTLNQSQFVRRSKRIMTRDLIRNGQLIYPAGAEVEFTENFERK